MLLRIAPLPLLLFLLTSCQAQADPPLIAIEGRTMGTTYSVKIPAGGQPPPAEVKQAIDEALAEVNRQMSTYIEDSEISRFNRAPADQWFEISPELYDVLKVSQDISAASEGAFDVTVGPLVNLWRFGPDKTRTEPPTDDELAEAKPRVDFRQLELQADPPATRKSRGDIYVDLSGVAKGFGSDEVARVLDELGIEAYLVEIGGEIRAKGVKPNAEPWRIGIEKPTEGPRELQQVVPLRDIALATSGDYRNFFIHEGVRHSHTIDPQTGKPVKHDLASVSVLSETCAQADAWATAMLVLGPTEGYNVAERHNLAVLFQERLPDGNIRVQATSAWQQYQQAAKNR